MDYRKYPIEDVVISKTADGVRLIRSSKAPIEHKYKDIKDKKQRQKVGDIVHSMQTIIRTDDELLTQRMEDPTFPQKVKENPSWGRPKIVETLEVHEMWNGRGWIGVKPDEPTKMYIFEEE